MSVNLSAWALAHRSFVWFLMIVTLIPFALGPDLNLLSRIGPAKRLRTKTCRPATEFIGRASSHCPSPCNAIAVPTDSYLPATDAEAVFLGKLESNYGVGASGNMRGSISGSIGFVLD